MKPDKEGIWEWFDKQHAKRLVSVVDCNKEHPQLGMYLRVYWWGGYYNVYDDVNEPVDSPFKNAEWSDNWGNYVGPLHSVKDSELYTHPTEEEQCIIDAISNRKD